MTQPHHTPHPWKLKETEAALVIVGPDEEQQVAWLPKPNGPKATQEILSNAYLLIAAPNLMEAAEAALHNMESVLRHYHLHEADSESLRESARALWSQVARATDQEDKEEPTERIVVRWTQIAYVGAEVVIGGVPFMVTDCNGKQAKLTPTHAFTRENGWWSTRLRLGMKFDLAGRWFAIVQLKEGEPGKGQVIIEPTIAPGEEKEEWVQPSLIDEEQDEAEEAEEADSETDLPPAA